MRKGLFWLALAAAAGAILWLGLRRRHEALDAGAPSFTPPERATAATPRAAPELEGIEGYCLRCKARRVIAHPHEELTESGRHGARGVCPVCGTNMFTFLPEERGGSV